MGALCYHAEIALSALLLTLISLSFHVKYTFYPDEDVMSEAELQRDNARKQRVIQHHLNQLSKALAKLEKLKHDYEASKTHAPPKRYQDLKDMIKTTVAEKF